MKKLIIILCGIITLTSCNVGKPKINKITNGFTYLTLAGLSPPRPNKIELLPTAQHHANHHADVVPNGVDCSITTVSPRPLTKASRQ